MNSGNFDEFIIITLPCYHPFIIANNIGTKFQHNFRQAFPYQMEADKIANNCHKLFVLD